MFKEKSGEGVFALRLFTGSLLYSFYSILKIKQTNNLFSDDIFAYNVSRETLFVYFLT